MTILKQLHSTLSSFVLRLIEDILSFPSQTNCATLLLIPMLMEVVLSSFLREPITTNQLNCQNMGTKRAANAAPSLEGIVRSSFPPLDPNGQPFSMILRGAAAELGVLRCAISAHPNARELLRTLDQAKGEECEVDKFGDVDDADDMKNATVVRDGLQGRHETNPEQQAETTTGIKSGGSAEETTDGKKRGRDSEEDEEEHDDEEEESDDEIVDQEQLLLYIPSVTCTCSSWKIKDVSGEMLVTSLRVLFLPKNQYDGGVSNDDVAIDGRCIALHAVDSVPSSDGDKCERDISHQHHVYCQLIELTGDEDDMGYSSTVSVVTPAKVVDEKNDTSNGVDENDEEVEEEDGSSEVSGDGTIEVYFKPEVHDEGGEDANIDRCNVICQSIFKSLTKLASLNPSGESDDGVHGGGGFFSMLSLMAGMGNGFGNGFDGEMVMANHNGDGDDDMVVRLGESNNFVENDDESEMAADMERQAMLRRLDDMLVVPPEYEINDGQFDDADEEDEDDADDDEIL